jgi:hypothetical protein
MKTRTKLFIATSFLAVASFVCVNMDAFILFGVPAIVLGISAIVRNFKTGEI